MSRFVVLFHETPTGHARSSHYDLMLEQGGVLWTWSLDQLPTPDHTVAAEKLADHRLTYLDYEGEISRGRGTVTRIDTGDYELLEQSTNRIRVEMRGAKLRGILTLAQPAQDSDQWAALLVNA